MHGRSNHTAPASRRWLASATLVLFGIGLALAIAEIGARLTWETAAADTDDRPAPPSHLEEIDDGVLGLAAPNAEGLYGGVYYRTNSSGFRGPEYRRHPAPGVLRIAVIGDSFVMGEGVLEENTYAAQLERLLDETRRGSFEALNFGIAGLNVRQVAARARRLVPGYHPHLVVYGFTLNDIEGPFYRTTRTAESALRQKLRYLRFSESSSYLLRVVWPRLVSLAELLRPRSGTYSYELFDNYFNNPPAWTDFERGLDEIAALGDRIGAPVVVLIHTRLSYLNRLHPYRPIYSKVSEAAASRGLQVIESLPHHYGHRPESLWVAMFDPHPNRRGHQILARALAEGLQDTIDELRAESQRGSEGPVE